MVLSNKFFKKDVNKPICVFVVTFAFLVFAVLTSFRSLQVGNDSETYSYLFYKFSENGFQMDSNIEYGFQLFCIIVSKFSLKENAIVVASGFLSYCLIIVYILRYSSKTPYVILIYFLTFFSYYLSGIRQGIAMAILLFAFQTIRRKQTIRTIVIILTASLFHLTALCFLLLLVLNNFKIIKNYAMVLTIVAVAALFFRFESSLFVSIMGRYSHYLTADGGFGVGWLGVTMSLIVYLSVSFISLRLSNVDREYKRTIFWASFLMLSFGFFAYVTHIFTRIAMFFEFPLIILSADLISKTNRKGIKWLYLLFLTSILLVQVLFRPEWVYFINYRFY